MKNIFLILLLLIPNAIALTMPSLEESAVVIKPGIRDYADSFNIKVENFKEMLIKNKIFIDNTLFIREAMTWYAWLYMTGPRKCGKTINLDMLKTFLEIQVDDQGNQILPKNITSNYKLFVNGEITLDDGTIQKLKTPPLISKEKEMIDLFLGEYPVIYVNFKDVTGNTAQEIKHSIGFALKQAFVQHEYMLKVFRKAPKNDTIDNLIDVFEYILNNVEDELSFDCIPFLCEVLYNHFKRKTVIIYDDYDKPFTNILQLGYFPKADVTQMIRIMDNLTLWSFRENKFIRKSFIMGTFELHRHPFAPWVGYTKRDLVLDYKEPIAQYFSFSRKVVDYLFEKYGLSVELSQQGHQWYKGFQSNRYNPFSIANFLNTNKTITYFVDREVERIAGPIISSSFKARKKILKLLSFNGSIRTTAWDARRRFNDEEVFILKWYTFDAKSLHGREEWITFAWYLIRKGYFSPRVLRAHEIIDNVIDNKIEYKIPNREIGTLICTRMIKYYQYKYEIAYQALLDAATSLFMFVINEAPSMSLANSLAEIYTQSSRFLISENDSGLNATIENPFRAIFTCVLLKMQHLSDFELDISYRRFKNPDYVIFNNRSGEALVLQINHDDQPVENTLEEVKKRQKTTLQRFNHTKTVRTVVLKIWPNRTVEFYPKDESTLGPSSDDYAAT